MGRPRVLLTSADFYGTLAAARCFGRAGIPVAVADPGLLAPSAWSRFTTTRLRSPDQRDTERLIEWLLELGRTTERQVLLPASDDTAWLFAVHREELGRYYYLLDQTADVIYSVLNKRQLHEHAAAVGFSVPRTFQPVTDADVLRCAREAKFPVVLKPVTQILYPTRIKGRKVDSPDRLLSAFRAFEAGRHAPRLLEFDPGAALPMVQEFHAEAAEGIYNVSGFAADGELKGALAARKVLQQPRQLGIGLCFEEAQLDPALTDGLTRLIKRVGFQGVFEAEFIVADGRFLLIDFNPRFYNQMAFDIARGLPLPLFAYSSAIGDSEGLAGLKRDAAGLRQLAGRVYAHGSTLTLMLSAQRLSGMLSAREIAAWKDWRARHRLQCTDAVMDPDDPAPAAVDSIRVLKHFFRHPRAFTRSLFTTG